MTAYLYETHLHTSESSKCSASGGADFARHFKRLGYTGIFVTDHFLNGNTPVSEDLPWPERVARFCDGYDTAAQEGRRIGLDVFFGWEYSYGWAHFLTYGLGSDWLRDNPEMLSWDLLRYADRVHADGGFIVHAHPFREGVDIVQLLPGKVDAVEVCNGQRDNKRNRHALDYANSFTLLRTAGSDIHSTEQKRRCGIRCPYRFTDARDYPAALASGEAVLFDTTSPDNGPAGARRAKTAF